MGISGLESINSNLVKSFFYYTILHLFFSLTKTGIPGIDSCGETLIDFFSLIPEVAPTGREQNILKIVFVNYGNSLTILDTHYLILRPQEPLNTFYCSCSSL